MPFVILFVLVAGIAGIFHEKLAAKSVNWVVVESANLLLFGFSLLNYYYQKKNIHNPNPAAVIRGVMAATFLKLTGLAAAAITYLLVAGEQRSVNAVFVGMALYIIYTWLEVRISLRMQPKK